MYFFNIFNILNLQNDEIVEKHYWNMHQKLRRATTLVLSVIACYTLFLAVLALCFKSGERILNIKVNQFFQIDFNRRSISNDKKQTDDLKINNNNNNTHPFQIIDKLSESGYNASLEITSYANTQNPAKCRLNLCKFQSFIKLLTLYISFYYCGDILVYGYWYILIFDLQ